MPMRAIAALGRSKIVGARRSNYADHRKGRIYNSPLKGTGVRDISIGDFDAKPIFGRFNFLSSLS